MMVRLQDVGKQPPTAAQKPPAASEGTLEERIVAALKGVYDPELPVNIYDLGLIYQVDIAKDGHVAVEMTLTAPACPVAGTLPGQVEQVVRGVDGVKDAKVALVWDPPWTRDKMSEEAQLALGLYG